ncbi:hypothetical protein ACKXGF_05120 [Alkalibacillus sp. S2W]|uniref:hypothetical protein n=1 Tax=Alkalibacillus sp. S2W TaxID=3386553 RepID=UPI00398CBE37
MPYIDKTYYDEDFNGLNLDDEQEFDRYAKRASDVIDQVTGYKIAQTDFESLPSFIQEQVKKATAAQIEFYQINDGPELLDAGDDFSNFATGNFTFSKGGKSENKQADRVSPSTIEHLRPTGLLYTGLGVIERAFY